MNLSEYAQKSATNLLPKFPVFLLYSHRRCFVKMSILTSFTKLTGKHLCWSLFFNNVADRRPATLLKKRLQPKCFPVNFPKYVRAPFLQNTSWRLQLCVSKMIFSVMARVLDLITSFRGRNYLLL